MLVGLAAASAAWPAAVAADVAEYDRAAVLRGEVWRLWTAHVVHYGASHLAWNLAVFLPASGWLERVAPARLRWLLVLTPAAIGVVLLATDPALARYAGLSGVATGVVTLLALTKLGAPGGDAFFWRAVLALIVVKIAVETVWRMPVFAAFDRPEVHTMPVAHLVGAAMAVAVHGAAWCRTGREFGLPRAPREDRGSGELG